MLNSSNNQSSNARKCASGNIKSIVHQAEVHADNSQVNIFKISFIYLLMWNGCLPEMPINFRKMYFLCL